MLRAAASRGASGCRPHRHSTNFRIDVWSYTSWSMPPRRANGENTNDGTRKPAWLWSKSAVGASSGSCGGGTWSKKPPHSSYVTINAVFDHSGDVAIAVAIDDLNPWPRGRSGWG